MPMQPVCEMLTLCSWRLSASSSSASSTGRAPAAMPQVAMPTLMTVSSPLATLRLSVCDFIFSRSARSSSKLFITYLRKW